MGVEYRISCAPEYFPHIREFLLRRGCQFAAEFRDCFELRDASSPLTEMPHAVVVLESGGIYFCDYRVSSASAVLFRALIDEALSRSGSSDSVTVSAL